MDAVNWPRAVLHLDMDAFYVNVHLLEHPEDRGVPLVVGGSPTGRGVVSSASYEARQFGIRSAMPTARALRLCPQLKIVPADWARIRDCSRQVMDVLDQYGTVEQLSVDEAYVDLSEQERPEDQAREVKSAVRAQTALPCSVGLATSKLLAKVASDYDKPDGYTVVRPGQERSFLAPLSARVIWGIGPRTAERLAQVGINTCGELAAADLATLQTMFGNQAEHLQRRARGVDNRTVKADRGPSKSISQEWTFSNDVAEEEILRRQLRKMCDSVSKSLRKRNLLAHTVVVKFRWADFTTFTRQRSLEVAIDGEDDIYRLAEAIWQAYWPEGRPMRLLGIGVTNLQPATVRQLGLNLE